MSLQRLTIKIILSIILISSCKTNKRPGPAPEPEPEPKPVPPPNVPICPSGFGNILSLGPCTTGKGTYISLTFDSSKLENQAFFANTTCYNLTNGLMATETPFCLSTTECIDPGFYIGCMTGDQVVCTAIISATVDDEGYTCISPLGTELE